MGAGNRELRASAGLLFVHALRRIHIYIYM